MTNRCDIADRLGCGLLVFDAALRIATVNSRAAEILQRPQTELQGLPLATVDGLFTDHSGAPFLHRECIGNKERLLGRGAAILRPEGQHVPISVNASPLIDPSENLVGLVIDFVPRSREEQRLHRFIGSMDEVVFQFDAEGRYLNVWTENPELLKTVPQELLGRRVEEVVPDELARKVKAVLARVRTTRKSETFEYPLDVIKGRRWFLARVAYVSPLEEEEPTFSFLAWDITPLKEQERRLRESRQKFRGIFDQSSQFSGLLRPDGTLLEINKTACAFLGVEESEVLYKPFWETPWWTHAPDQQQRLREAIMQAAQGRPVRFEAMHRDADGNEHYFECSIKPVLDESGEVMLLIPEAREITERKRAEEKLQESIRDLEAFAHTVSHDLRTPLTAILGYTQFFRELYKTGLDEQGLQMLREIEKNSQRMQKLIEDLLLLARLGKLERPARAVDLNRVAREVIANLTDTIFRHGAEIKTAKLPSARIPETLLVQIFDNLVSNAVRYAGRTGSPIEVGGDGKNGRIRIYVRDHGPGIAPGEESRVFDLFHRGARGKGCLGSGVGLTTVQKIARKYGGDAWVEETPGGGATFWVEMKDEDGCD